MAGNRLMRRVRALSMSLFKTLRNIWGGSTRQLPADVQPDELLTSFVVSTENKLFGRQTRYTPRGLCRGAILTNKRLEVSVCRSSKLTEAAGLGTSVRRISTFMRRNQPLVAVSVPLRRYLRKSWRLTLTANPTRSTPTSLDGMMTADKPDNELKHFWMDQAQRMAKQFSYMPRR